MEKVFSLLGQKAQAKECDTTDELIKEAQSIIERARLAAFELLSINNFNYHTP